MGREAATSAAGHRRRRNIATSRAPIIILLDADHAARYSASESEQRPKGWGTMPRPGVVRIFCHLRAIAPFVAVVLGSSVAAAAIVRLTPLGLPLPTTAKDFLQPGTQPLTLKEPIPDSTI